MLPLVFANSRLKEWKRQKGYYETQSTERYVELKNAGAIRCIHFFQFFLPLAIGIIGAALALPVYKMVGISCLIGAACGFIYFLVAVIMDRQPIQVISSDSDININYSRAKKNIWKNFWLCCIWMNTILILFLLAISFVDKKVETKVNAVADKARELSEELRRNVTVEELAEESGMSVKTINDAIRMSGFKIENIDTTGGNTYE